MKKAIITIIAAVFMLFLAGPARAALITIAIEATVDYVRDDGNYLEGRISPGDVITGSYTYESTTLDSNPITDYAAYYQYDPLCSVLLTVGGFEFKSDTANLDYRIAISNGYQSRDSYSIGSANNLVLSNGISVDSIYWLLVDYTCSAVQTDALLTTAPVLDQWEENELYLDGGRLYGISGHVTSAVVIPESATMLLFGLAGLLLRRRRG